MAAGQGFKTFTTGEVLTAADVNGYLMQGVLVFASAAARDAAITSPQEGQFAFTKDTNGLWYYDGAAWVASGATGDIEGVTAGIGISGGGTSGTVTVTNSMATAIDAKGDLIAGTGADTFARLAVGADDLLVSAASAETTGLKYAGAWTTWTPTYTDMNAGNGTVTARYAQMGKTIFFDYKIIWGSTTSITGGAPTFSLPKASVSPVFFFDGNIFDAGVQNYGGAGQVVGGQSIVYIKVYNVAGTYPVPAAIGSTVPMTWTTNDEFQLHGFYEVA